MNTFIFDFVSAFKSYCIEIIPALAIGFLLSGIVHEFLSDEWINRHLGGRGIKGVLYSTVIGTIMPVCCWGSLPIAVSLYMKGAALGPILAILIATPATSINALIVTWKFLGLKFAIYIFFAVIFMGIVAGMVGNMIKLKPKAKKEEDACPHCKQDECTEPKKKKSFPQRVRSVFNFAFIKLPKEIGLELLGGMVLAALIGSLAPAGAVIRDYLAGNIGYLFSIIFGISMYMCATMSVPMVDAFINQGLGIGPGLALLLIGPITSYGTILVLRKEFGVKILLIYLGLITALSVILGYLYTLL